MSDEERDGVLFLGLDSSTQGLKATIIDERLGIVCGDALNFDADLSGYGTEDGVHKGEDGVTVTSPAMMWVEALDVLLARMKESGCPLERVVAVSGSGQQHGSVWLAPGAGASLSGLRPDRALHEQLAGLFTVSNSPVWMDSSTTRQCRELESAMGGAQAVADLTGSRAYERFTGNQIAKIHQALPETYAGTERIALVSSFVTSLLVGNYTPIDASDGSGMNLMDIRTKTWSTAALEATAPDLGDKLGDVAPSHRVVGKLHSYYVEKYGMSPECAVVAFSGDNPCSLAGLRLQEVGDIAVSLGTSDTMFGSLSEPRPSGVEGHIFVNPVAPDAFMAMVCYKNGSLTRESVRDEFASGDWGTFEGMFPETPVGNGGKIGFYVREPEITPPIMATGIRRFDSAGHETEFTPAENVRAIVEGQFLSMRLHGSSIGLVPGQILATGGASANASILKVMSDVFGVPVYTADVTDTASLGAAYRAAHGWKCRAEGRFVSFAEAMSAAPPFSRAAEADMTAHGVYSEMLGRYAELEKKLVGNAE